MAAPQHARPHGGDSASRAAPLLLPVIRSPHGRRRRRFARSLAQRLCAWYLTSVGAGVCSGAGVGSGEGVGVGAGEGGLGAASAAAGSAVAGRTANARKEEGKRRRTRKEGSWTRGAVRHRDLRGLATPCSGARTCHILSPEEEKERDGKEGEEERSSAAGHRSRARHCGGGGGMEMAALPFGTLFRTCSEGEPMDLNAYDCDLPCKIRSVEPVHPRISGAMQTCPLDLLITSRYGFGACSARSNWALVSLRGRAISQKRWAADPPAASPLGGLDTIYTRFWNSPSQSPFGIAGAAARCGGTIRESITGGAVLVEVQPVALVGVGLRALEHVDRQIEAPAPRQLAQPSAQNTGEGTVAAPLYGGATPGAPWREGQRGPVGRAVRGAREGRADDAGAAHRDAYHGRGWS
eukprot:gene9605-biopygen3345